MHKGNLANEKSKGESGEKWKMFKRESKKYLYAEGTVKKANRE